MKTVTIEDCLNLHKQGVETVINDGKIKAFIKPKNELVEASIFFNYFVASER